jgi:hypothetical protein
VQGHQHFSRGQISLQTSINHIHERMNRYISDTAQGVGNAGELTSLENTIFQLATLNSSIATLLVCAVLSPVEYLGNFTLNEYPL